MRPFDLANRQRLTGATTFFDQERGNAVKLILLGARGAGKGRVAKLLTQMDGSVQISTGDILRGAVAAGTELGKQAEAALERSDLVSDGLIMGIMEKRLQEPDCAKGFLLDGFPRTIPQAEALKLLLAKLGIKLDMVVSIEVPRHVILDRPSNRLLREGRHVCAWERPLRRRRARSHQGQARQVASNNDGAGACLPLS